MLALSPGIPGFWPEDETSRTAMPLRLYTCMQLSNGESQSLNPTVYCLSFFPYRHTLQLAMFVPEPSSLFQKFLRYSAIFTAYVKITINNWSISLDCVVLQILLYMWHAITTSTELSLQLVDRSSARVCGPEICSSRRGARKYVRVTGCGYYTIIIVHTVFLFTLLYYIVFSGIWRSANFSS